MSSPLLLDDVSYSIGKKDLFKHVSLELPPRQSVAIVGASGVGKSTLLALALGLTKATSGTVTAAGMDLGKASRRARLAHRAEHIGVVFQHAELIAELSPLENVMLPALWSGARSGPAQRAQSILAEIGVDTDAPSAADLSGGERQRVAVARAVMSQPELLLADEPTGALDTANATTVADLIFGLPTQHGCGLLVVTHDDRIAQRADRVYELTANGLRDVE